MDEEGQQLVAQIQQLLQQKDFKGSVFAATDLLERVYREGYKHAVENYAVWKDGEQFVGVLRRPLKKVLEEVDLGEF